ncbi:putative eka-like protein [Golovinomyces cichoracearum]|uniref:Putative eka-like protein n=1 Tax=Golovinomyces cichoracearum TaxID=62708 RepID=A0A420I5W9_9PEZI|nr:putative eka-like protein [Golovinomyces cichoracearum]
MKVKTSKRTLLWTFHRYLRTCAQLPPLNLTSVSARDCNMHSQRPTLIPIAPLKRAAQNTFEQVAQFSEVESDQIHTYLPQEIRKIKLN